jgi:hypothetical protein
MKIISADERMREKAGVKMLFIGPAKIGKTTQLRTLDPERTLFVDLEAGDLAVQDVPVDTLRPQTWEQCRDLACFLTGPNPALPPTACYSQAHYDAIRASFWQRAFDMLDLAHHIVERKSGHFAPQKFEDEYENALKELLQKKQAGQPIERPERPEPARVINLMDALRRSVEASRASPKPAALSVKGRRPQAEQPRKKRSRRAT